MHNTGCLQCGEVGEVGYTGLCAGCIEQNKKDEAEIKRLIIEGHTEHCAKRQIWGDGECECGCAGNEISDVIAQVMSR